MNINLTKKEQLVGLLTGLWSAEADAAFRSLSHREVLTVKKADVLEYLKENSLTARDYLTRWEGIRPASDINVIWADGDVYKVAWMTRDSKPWAIQNFRDLNEAIAEHVCRQNGLQE